jgi:hypothetical protein
LEGNRTKVQENRVMFFEKLKEISRVMFNFYFFDNISSEGGYDASLVKSIGMGVLLKYWKKTGPGAVVELIIENKDINLNKVFYEYLLSQKDTIEREFGGPLSWDGNINQRTGKVNPKRFSIRKKYAYGELIFPETWEELQKEMIKSMIKFYAIFPPRLLEFKDKYGR